MVSRPAKAKPVRTAKPVLAGALSRAQQQWLAERGAEQGRAPGAVLRDLVARAQREEKVRREIERALVGRPLTRAELASAERELRAARSPAGFARPGRCRGHASDRASAPS